MQLKRLALLPIWIMLIAAFSSSSAAYSAVPYTDVEAWHPYAAGIRYAYDNELAFGAQELLFFPNQSLIIGDWAKMLCAAFDIDTSSRTAVRACFEEKLIGYSILNNEDSFVSRGVLYLMALDAAGYEVFDKELYVEGDWSNWDSSVYMGQLMGLAGEDAAGDEYVTRGEAVELLRQLHEHKLEQPLPPIMSEVLIETEDGWELNEYLHQVALVPETIRESFLLEGWKMVVGDDYINDYNKEHDASAIGLACFDSKTIFVAKPNSVVHEFGHFLQWTLRDYESFECFFEWEAEQSTNPLDTYARTNSLEYFAEVFEYRILYPNIWYEAQVIIPKTAAFFDELEGNDWGQSEFRKMILRRVERGA